MKKPKLWKYKSGSRKGKLRNSAKQYLSFKLKETFKRKRILKAQFEKAKEDEREIPYRYSIALFNEGYGLTARAEFTTTKPKDEQAIFNHLQKTLNNWLSKRIGLNKINFSPDTLAMEKEKIGINDISIKDLNKTISSVSR